VWAEPGGEAFLHEKEIWFEEEDWNQAALGLPSWTMCAGQFPKSEPALLCERGIVIEAAS